MMKHTHLVLEEPLKAAPAPRASLLGEEMAAVLDHELLALLDDTSACHLVAVSRRACAVAVACVCGQGHSADTAR